MSNAPPATSPSWPLWQRVAFRFIAVALTLLIVPDLIAGSVPIVGRAMNGIVELSNAQLFHVRPTLIQPNGSGDTSWAWARLWLVLLVAAGAAVVWSIVDARRQAYPVASYWLRTLLRYQLASAALTYGIIKVFTQQMAFPTLSQLSTPLGDLLPMRLSWLFIGYSTPYQMFCGVMEVLAGLLLLPRRTVTVGLVLAAATFTNVLLINLAYDVPVKLYASQLFLSSVVLLAMDAPRLTRGLLLNQPIGRTALYDPPSDSTRGRIIRGLLKLVILVVILIIPLQNSWQRAQSAAKPVRAVPLAVGVYEVQRFVRNHDTIPALSSDSLRWRDVIIDNAMQGSVGSTDTAFWQRYRRGYFRYKADTSAHLLTVWRTSVTQDSTFLFTARYVVRDSTRAQLWTTLHGDSLYVELVRSPRHFQLAERQFHWLSEYNR